MSAVFSEFELRQLGIKFTSGTEYSVIPCIGSFEEEMDAKVVSKLCRGVVKKKTVKGTGTGTLKVTLHCPYDVYCQAYGMDLEGLMEGVKAYGQNSRHEAFSLTADVYDEDDNRKVKAYPNCIIESGRAAKVENGAGEVAEIELTINVMPDDYGNGVYEALITEDNATLADQFLTNFTSDLVQATT